MGVTWGEAKRVASDRQIWSNLVTYNLSTLQVLHRWWANDADGGRVALIYRDDLKVAPMPVISQFHSADFLVAKMVTRRGQLNISAVYRPPTSSKYAVPVQVFCEDPPCCSTSCCPCLDSSYCAANLLSLGVWDKRRRRASDTIRYDTAGRLTCAKKLTGWRA